MKVFSPPPKRAEVNSELKYFDVVGISDYFRFDMFGILRRL